MAIKITIGKKKKEVKQPPPPKVADINLKISKSVNGDLFISDHSDIDIIIMIQKNKILLLPKDIMSELVYGAEDRFFDFMIKKGLIDPESIQGGLVYGSMEGYLYQSEKIKVINMVLLNISKWIDLEKPYFEFMDKFEEMETDYFVEPSDEDTTELGEVPQAPEKGTIRPGISYGPYWQNYQYE